MKSLAETDRRHEEVIGRLPELTPKLAAIRLLEYLESLPSVASRPGLLFYHTDALQRLCSLVVGPFAFSTHPKLLRDLMAVLGAAGDSNVARRVGPLADAKMRLGLLLCAEHGMRREWEEALSAAREAGISLPDSGGRDGVDRIDGLLQSLRAHDSAEGLRCPYHFLDTNDLPAGAILGVLVDGEDVPLSYREAYLCTVDTELKLTKRREAPEPVVRARDERGEDLPLSDELKDLVREAVARSFVLLGPVAQRKLHQVQVEIDVSIRRPAIVTQLAGRSILLPLVLSLSRNLALKLNLAGVPMPRRDVVWSGDVDEHGGVRHVDRIEEKAARVLASRAGGFAYPAEDDEAVRQAVGGEEDVPAVRRFPVAHVQDCIGNPALVAIRGRSHAARLAHVLKQRTKPLGIAGTAAAAAVLLAIGFAVPRLASWLDRSPASARFAGDNREIELVNSRDRTLRRFRVEPCTTDSVVLADVDGDGETEVLYGTTIRDSIPGVLFCLDSRGHERWRFKGGFRPGDARPNGYENNFGACGAYVRDLDGDGRNEIVATFAHNPWCPYQIALLESDGTYVSSFWHLGHLSSGGFVAGGSSFIARDIDRDGREELLLGGINNRCRRAVLIILDPRSMAGAGPDCRSEAMAPTWQSYVLFPACRAVEQAAGSPGTAAWGAQVVKWGGEDCIRVDIYGELAGEGRRCFYTYVLDFDLNVVDFYCPDTFAVWAGKALGAGRLSTDVSSPTFSEEMRRIEILPGPPDLMLP
jgi:hypothetical protein